MFEYRERKGYQGEVEIRLGFRGTVSLRREEQKRVLAATRKLFAARQVHSPLATESSRKPEGRGT
jgi:hypothetical protein